MKPFTWPERIAAAIVVALAIGVAVWLVHRDGEKKGALNQEIKASAVVVKAARLNAAAAIGASQLEDKKLVAKTADYTAARSKIVVKGDTVISDGLTVEMPSVAIALNRADSLRAQVPPAVAEHARSDSLQASLVGALDHHVDLVEEVQRPRLGVKTGIAVGVIGTVAVVYVALKIIRAVGHN